MTTATGKRARNRVLLPAVLFCLGLLALPPAGAEDTRPQASPPAGPAKYPEKPPAEKPEKTSPARPRPRFKLPTDAVVLVCQEVKEALDLVPRAVVLTPEKYQELLKRLADLERAVKARPVVALSTCKLKVLGPLDGDLAVVRAEFSFQADPRAVKDHASVALGCKGAPPRKAELDGKEATLEFGEDGYLIPAVAGEHTLVLELELPLVSRGLAVLGGGTDRGFDLNLPRAAITTFELEQMPGGVKEVHCNDLTLRRAGEARALGAVERLSVSWKKPPAAGGNGALLMVDGKITVHVEEKLVRTEAELTLQDVRGRTATWVIEGPPGSTLEVAPLGERGTRAPAATVRSVSRKERNQVVATVHTVELKDPDAEPFRVLVRARQPRTAGRIRIDPVRVLNNPKEQPGTVIHHQEGTVVITAPPDVRLEYFPPPRDSRLLVGQRKSLTKPRQDTQDVFHYWVMPGPGKPGPGRPFLLEMEVKTVQGVLETRVDQHLELKKANQGWEVAATTKITYTPRWRRVKDLEIQLPPDWPDYLPVAAAWPRPGLPVGLALAFGPWPGRPVPPGAFPAHYTFRSAFLQTVPVETIQVDHSGRAHILLADPKDTEFTLVLRGVYRLPRGEEAARLDLPRPVKTLDRGGQVDLVLDPALEGFQLRVRENGREGPDTNRYQSASSEAAPEQLAFSWKPQWPAAPVRMEVDLTLLGGRARVEQRVIFPSAEPGGRRLRFLLPGGTGPGLTRAVGDSLHSANASLRRDNSSAPGAAGAWSVGLDGGGRPPVLEYTFPLPAAGRVQVPLLWPEVKGPLETRVRVWSEAAAGPGNLALAADSRWKEGPIDIVPGRDRLPLLVLHGLGRQLPLTLQLTPSSQPPLATVLVRRGLIQVRDDGERGTFYQARFPISQWNSRSLEVELPAEGAVLDAVRIDGQLVLPRTAGPGAGGRSPRRAPHFRVVFDPGPGRAGSLLEIMYHLAPPSPGSNSARGLRWLGGRVMTLRPPVLRGAVFLDRVRWQVEMPGEVILSLDRGAVVEQEWGWRGWLPGPRPALDSADLETWLTGSRKSVATPDQEASLLCWQNRPQDITILRMEDTAWLALCSLPVLVIGLGVSFVSVTRKPLRVACGLLLGLAVLGLLTVVVGWPSTLPALVYGCLPGAAVLAMVLGIQWMLHRRYRRQLVFMPGFTRLKTGSGLARSGSSQRPKEASTVDGPTAAPDGKKSGVKSQKSE